MYALVFFLCSLRVDWIPNRNNYFQTVFPDTVYGYQSTQTRLASDTADDLIWGRYSSRVGAIGRIQFSEKQTDKPLHYIQTFASEFGSGRLLVVLGRSRRLATDSHSAELKKLLSDNHTSIGGEAAKTLGEVGTAVMSGGVGEGILVVQARVTA